MKFTASRAIASAYLKKGLNKLVDAKKINGYCSWQLYATHYCKRQQAYEEQLMWSNSSYCLHVLFEGFPEASSWPLHATRHWTRYALSLVQEGSLFSCLLCYSYLFFYEASYKSLKAQITTSLSASQYELDSTALFKIIQKKTLGLFPSTCFPKGS